VPDLLPLQLGAFGVLLLVVYFIFRAVVGGHLVPKVTVDALLAARDAEIVRANQRADGYMGLYETERTSREIVTDQNRELIEVARTVEHVVESLRLVAEGRASNDPSV
jgi:hypothetical protein